MPTYHVVVRATVTKTLVIEAEDEDLAVEKAHEEFSVLEDGTDENYTQDTIEVCKA